MSNNGVVPITIIRIFFEISDQTFFNAFIIIESLLIELLYTNSLSKQISLNCNLVNLAKIETLTMLTFGKICFFIFLYHFQLLFLSVFSTSIRFFQLFQYSNFSVSPFSSIVFDFYVVYISPLLWFISTFSHFFLYFS